MVYDFPFSAHLNTTDTYLVGNKIRNKIGFQKCTHGTYFMDVGSKQKVGQRDKVRYCHVEVCMLNYTYSKNSNYIASKAGRQKSSSKSKSKSSCKPIQIY